MQVVMAVYDRFFGGETCDKLLGIWCAGLEMREYPMSDRADLQAVLLWVSFQQVPPLVPLDTFLHYLPVQNPEQQLCQLLWQAEGTAQG